MFLRVFDFVTDIVKIRLGSGRKTCRYKWGIDSDASNFYRFCLRANYKLYVISTIGIIALQTGCLTVERLLDAEI